MEDLHNVFTRFKEDFPVIHERHEALGKQIHEESGPLEEKTRWLIKVAISAASRHLIALETHIAKTREAGATEDEIRHCLLLLLQTTGFPAFMEAYSVYKRMG